MTDSPIPPMVERAAAAAWKSVNEHKDVFAYVGRPGAGRTIGYAAVTVDGEVDFYAVARAVIEALRDPPDEVCEATRKPIMVRILKDWVREPVHAYLDACLGKETTKWATPRSAFAAFSTSSRS